MTTLPVLLRKTTLPYTGRAKSRHFPRRGLRLPRRGFGACPLAVPEKRIGCSALFLAFFDRGAKPCSLYPPQAALAGFARNDNIEPEQPKKQHPCGVLFFWRRRRDSNPRVAFDTAYALSRGASSPLEYFSMVAFIRTILFFWKGLAERMGFEPMALTRHRFSGPAP